ncbi:major facilitator superfamily domain-containing protein [Scenedesmus sp. NREL 46B-D3]|nr:major facilitator superfamily domain-containing protein [Scenedesmus sp. NREL 46B-D3]
MLGISQAFNITSVRTKEAIVGAAKLGACFGTFLGGALMLRYGRRRAIAAQSVFFVAGPLVMAAATGPGGSVMELAMRLLCGGGGQRPPAAATAGMAERVPLSLAGRGVARPAALPAQLPRSAPPHVLVTCGRTAPQWAGGLGCCLPANPPRVRPRRAALGRLPAVPRCRALVAGRFLVGLGIGASAIVVPAYLAEIAPAAKRGGVVQTYEVMLTLGMLSAGVVNWLLSTKAGPAAWRWMVGLPAAPGALLLVSLLLLPESPRWLVLRGQLDSALATLHNIVQASGSHASGSSGRTGSPLDGGSSSEEQALAKAEDELLLLWSSVQKEQAAGLELRQQHQQQQQQQQQQHTAVGGAGAHAAGRHSPVLHAGHAHSPGQHNGSSHGSGLQINHEAAAAAAAAAAPRRGLLLPQPQTPNVGQRAPDGAPASRRQTLSSIDEDEEQQKQQQQQQWPPADDSQSEQLLSRYYQRSTVEGEGMPPSGSGSSSGTGHLYGRATDPVRSWLLRPSRQQGFAGAPQQQQQQWQQCEPGREAHFLATLAAMLADVAAVVRGPERAAFAIAASLAVLNQATASTAIINYAPELLQSLLGVTQPGAAVRYAAFISLTKVLGVCAAVLLVDAWGRRPLLAWGGIGCGASLFAAGAALTLRSVPLFVLSLCLFMFAFSISWAGLYWVVVSELFSMGAKSSASSAATSLLFLTGAVINFVFLGLVHWLGPPAFLLFGAVGFASAWYVLRAVPETKGRTLVEVQALLAAPANSSAAVTDTNGDVRYGRWRGWDWGRSTAPATAAAAAAARSSSGGATPAAAAAAGGGESEGAMQSGGQQPQPGDGDSAGAGAAGGGRVQPGDSSDHHAAPGDADAAAGGQFWQHWLQRQQQRQAGAADVGMALPLGLELMAVGGGSRRQQQQQQQQQVPQRGAEHARLVEGRQ